MLIAAAVEDFNTVLAENHQQCLVDTFMIRDSVCDEATNNAQCLFDGGDCCLEFKVTTLCQDCSCILAIDVDAIGASIKDLNIKPLAHPGQLAAFNATATLQVIDVVSAPVCAMLCLQHDKADKINAWHYFGHVQFCKCGWIQSEHCPGKVVQSEWTFNTVSDLEDHSFIQLNKTLPCGRLYLHFTV